MPSITTHGILLRYTDYRDHDRMLSILSPEHGLIQALSRGCRRPRSPLMPASELFVQGEFVLYQKQDRYTLTSCTLEDTFYPLRLEPYRLTCASYAASLCAVVAQPDEEEAALYTLMLNVLYRLAYDSETDSLGLINVFLLLLADKMGYRPRLSHCTHCRKRLPPGEGARLDIVAGGICCPDCAAKSTIPLTNAQLNWMRGTLRDGMPEHEKTGDRVLFLALRQYIECRIETTIKASRLLP